MSQLWYLSRRDVERLALTPAELVGLMEQAFRFKAAGQVELPPKPGVYPRPQAFIHAMPAYVRPLDAAGLKWVAAYPGNTRRGLPHVTGLIVLNDTETGVPVAVMDATWVTAMRTAAVSALSARFLGPDGEITLGIYGLGVQARSHLKVMAELLPVKRVVAYDEREERVQAFLRDAPGLAADVRAEAARSAEAMVRASNVVVTAGPIVKSPRPVVRASWLAEGILLLPVDFDASLEPEVFGRFERLVVDDIPQFEYYRSLGYFRSAPAAALELADLVEGRHAGRRSASERHMALNLGLAMEDVVVAQEIYRRARAQGIGTPLPL